MAGLGWKSGLPFFQAAIFPNLNLQDSQKSNKNTVKHAVKYLIAKKFDSILENLF